MDGQDGCEMGRAPEGPVLEQDIVPGERRAADDPANRPQQHPLGSPVRQVGENQKQRRRKQLRHELMLA